MQRHNVILVGGTFGGRTMNIPIDSFVELFSKKSSATVRYEQMPEPEYRKNMLVLRAVKNIASLV